MFRMDKGLNICCAECIFLNKQNKIDGGNCYSYGCLKVPRTQIVGWMHSDNELKTMGCSDCNKITPGDIFVIKSRFDDTERETWLYCGKINNKYLIKKLKTKLYVYQIVEREHFRGQTGKLVSTFEIIEQTEQQKEFHKRLAKNVKRRYMEKQCLK